MRQYLLLLLVCATLLSSCDKEDSTRSTVCTDSPISTESTNCTGQICLSVFCEQYEGIWKELFLQRNGVDEQYFHDHITICSTNIHSWTQGLSFRVTYKIKIGWAETYVTDSFIVFIAPGNTLYPALDLPRGTYLKKEQVNQVIASRAFNSQFSKVSGTKELRYPSQQEALQALIQHAQVSTLCYRDMQLDRTTGNMVLRASGEFNTNSNECLAGTIDVATGAASTEEVPCLIF